MKLGLNIFQKYFHPIKQFSELISCIEFHHAKQITLLLDITMRTCGTQFDFKDLDPGIYPALKNV
jgi:hypothetical protein